LLTEQTGFGQKLSYFMCGGGIILGWELGLYAAKSCQFGRFQKWFRCKYFVWSFGLFWVFLKIWPNLGLICMWYHIPEFKHSKCLRNIGQKFFLMNMKLWSTLIG